MYMYVYVYIYIYIYIYIYLIYLYIYIIYNHHIEACLHTTMFSRQKFQMNKMFRRRSTNEKFS